MRIVLKPDSWLVLLLLAVFVALGPLSTDMYLPALPAMVDMFGTTVSSVQLTISGYLLGFAVFHLVCGPLSDRFGRKPILILGLSIFTLSCIGCATAGSIETLIAWRFIQGAGACTGSTLGRAMIRDIYGPTGAAKALAYMAAIMALAPVIAPTLGGWMIIWFDWAAIFWFLCIYAVLGIVIIALLLPETLAEKQSIKLREISRNYQTLVLHREYISYVLAASCLYAGAFAFISGSSFVLIDYMGVAPEKFGLWFMLIVFGYILGSVFTGRFAQNFQQHKLMLAGALLGLVAGLIMALALLIKINHPLVIVLPVALYTGAIGITLPQSMAVALAPFPKIAGTASALMGFTQMSLSSIAGAIVGYLLKDNPMPMAVVISCCGLLSCLLFFRVIRKI